MKTCAACQKQIPDDARTCAFCGMAVQAPSQVPPYDTVANLNAADAKPLPENVPNFSAHMHEPHSLGRTVAIAAIVVVILAGAAGAGYYFFGRSSGEPKPAPTSETVNIPATGRPATPADQAGGPAVVAAPVIPAFLGSWVNEDSLTRDKTRIEITEEGGGLSVHMFERSTPGEKDMGTTVGFIDPATGAVALTWALPEKTEQQHLKLLQDGRLKLWGSVQFTRGSARINREYDNYFKKAEPPPPTEEELKAAEKEKAAAAKGKKPKRGR